MCRHRQGVGGSGGGQGAAQRGPHEQPTVRNPGDRPFVAQLAPVSAIADVDEGGGLVEQVRQGTMTTGHGAL